MKALAIFITLLILMTGFDLCKDEDSCVGEERIELSKTGTDKHQEEAPCTPFCHCVRCPFSIVLPSVKTELHVLGVNSEQFDTYLARNSFEFSTSVWQPPKYS